MYYALKDTTRLHKEESCVVVFSVEDTGALLYIHPVYAVLLALLDGKVERDDLLHVLTAVFSYETDGAAEILDKALTDFADFLVTSPKPSPIKQRYEATDFLFEPHGDPNLRRLSAPISVAWLVTERCPFNCIYCCIRTYPVNATDTGEMTSVQAERFVEDCIRSGVQSVTVHGGEPFLRQDLPELMGHLLTNDVHVCVSTKLPMKEKTVERLAEIGLPELQISIDSPDASEADHLVGRSGYLRGAFRNIDLLQQFGISVKSNTVVTSRNVHQIPELLRELAAMGVRKMTLAGYLRGFWTHEDRLFPDPHSLQTMAEKIERLKGELPEVELTMCPLESPREASLSNGGKHLSGCSGGRSGLVVGADGKVNICDRMVGFDDVVVGDVTESSLMEIWDGNLLANLMDPPPEFFTGTACADCSMMDACNRRTRCYYRTKMVDGRLFGPDYLCPVVPPPPLRFF